MKLVIVEKPSVAVAIVRKNGYYEGNEYIVSWYLGHLIQMPSPDRIDEDRIGGNGTSFEY